jgi:hypothetical protein
VKVHQGADQSLDLFVTSLSAGSVVSLGRVFSSPVYTERERLLLRDVKSWPGHSWRTVQGLRY